MSLRGQNPEHYVVRLYLLTSRHPPIEVILLSVSLPSEVLQMVVHSIRFTTARTNRYASFDPFLRDYCPIYLVRTFAICWRTFFISIFVALALLFSPPRYLYSSLCPTDALILQLHYPVLRFRKMSLKSESGNKVQSLKHENLYSLSVTMPGYCTGEAYHI